MTQDHYKVSLRGLNVPMQIGIADWERGKTQTVVVDVDLFGENTGPFGGTSIEDCVDYARLFSYVTTEWPKRPHTDLLETLVEDLVAFCFRDKKVTACRVCLSKPEVFNGKAIPSIEFFRCKKLK